MKRGASGKSANGPLANMFAKRSCTSEQIIDIDEVDATTEDAIARESDVVSHETATDAAAVDCDAIRPLLAQRSALKAKFRVSQDDPELAYLECKNIKNKQGAIAIHWN